MITSSDMTARLLAQENINIVRAAAKTASFDVLSRILTIPLWKDMTPEIEDMMQCHEVGHALFTDAASWIKSIDSFEKSKQRVMHGYMNVVEDARIEKLMKRRYPGCRKSFYAAYKQLLDRDFFKIKNKDVNAMSFIDRINLYFKGGVTLGIKFTTEEKVFVNKVEEVETIEQAMDVALQIYEFSKAKAKEQKSETSHDDIKFDLNEDKDKDSELQFEEFDDDDDDEDADSEDGEGESEEESSTETPSPKVAETKSTSAKTDAQIDEEIESETDKNLNKSLEELADTSIKYEYYEVNTALANDPIVSFKNIISETSGVDSKIAADDRNNFENFMKDSERVVNYLVKEFEMRKSAQTYRRQQISKSGSLNMNKIHQYKLTDDIFKRVMSVADGKNHGMVFLLDWSGSMRRMITDTLKQVINLVMFCRRVNIPFEVYAFTGNYYNLNWDSKQYTKNNNFTSSLRRTSDNIIFSDGLFNLLNLFSSKMNNKEFNLIARRFSSEEIQMEHGYALGDTPLNEALCYMLDFIPEFKRRNNIEKLTMVTLTDGQGGCLSYSNNPFQTYSYEKQSNQRIKIKNFIRDTKTQKTYKIDSAPQSQTEALLRMIKDRYSVASLGFYLCENRQRILTSAFTDNVAEDDNENREYYAHKNTMESKVAEMRRQFSEKGFYSMMNTGRDELFVIPSSSTKIVDEELELDSDASAATIARKFGKNLNNRKHSRVLLDRFISYIA